MIVQADDPRDRALFSALPTALAPKFGSLPEIETGRTRLILARDGLYIEAASRVLRARARIAAATGLPYGAVEPYLENLTGDDCEALLARAAVAARGRCPLEWAGVIVSEDSAAGGVCSLIEPPVLQQSTARVQYATAGLEPLDLVWDLHSHGRAVAYFSGQDDLDDCLCPSPVFMAAVIGRCHQAEPDWATRLIIGSWAFDDLGDLRRVGRSLASLRSRAIVEACSEE